MRNVRHEHIHAMVRNFLSALMSEIEPVRPESDFDEHELELGDDYQLDALDHMLSGQTAYSVPIQKDVEAIIASGPLSAETISPEEREMLLIGAARARKELIHYAVFRRQNLFDQYQPHDKQFSEQSVQLASCSSPKDQDDVSSKGTGATISEMIDKYIKDMKDEWTEQTCSEKQAPLRWFAEMVSPDRDVRLISTNDILAFRDVMKRLRKGVKASCSIHDIQTDDAALRVHTKTARKKYDTVMAFLRWLYKLGAIESIPGDKLSFKVKATPASQTRRPFCAQDFNTLFSSPLYTGCHSLKKRYQPGSVIKLDDDYWLPLVLAYSGMRMNEPLQLAAEDVVLEPKHPYFRLDSTKIQLKTASSDRRVPIHPDLEEFGFLDFVAKRQAKQPKQRLFCGITSEKSLSNYYSQRLGRYLDRVGLDDPRLVAHSFRHAFKDALRNAKVPEGDQHFICGHSDKSAAHNYGSGSDISVLADWVSQIDLGLGHSVKQKLIANRAIA